MAEDGVLAIELRRGTAQDEELAVRGRRIGTGMGHRDRAGDVSPLPGDLGDADRRAAALAAPPRVAAHVTADRIADLHEKAGLIAVEALPVVEVLLHELDDPRNRLGRFFGIRLDLDRPFRRFEHENRPRAWRILLRICLQ